MDNDTMDQYCETLKNLQERVYHTIGHLDSNGNKDHRQSFDIASRILSAHLMKEAITRIEEYGIRVDTQ